MFKLVLPYFKLYKKELILSIIGIIIESSLELSCPYLMKLLLEKGLILEPNGSYSLNIDVVIILSSLMLLIGIFAFIFGLLFAFNVSKFTKGVLYEVRKNEYQKLNELSLKNLDSISNSSLLARLTSDINIVADALSLSFRPLFRSVIVLIFTLAIALITSPELAIVYLITFPILAIIMGLIVYYVRPRYRKTRKIVDEVNKFSNETIISIKTIKSYVKEDYQKEEFDKINSNLRNLSFQTMSKNALLLPSHETVLFLTTILLLFLGGYLAQKPEYASIVVNISMFLTYTSQLLASVQMMTNVLLQTNRANASVIRIKEFLNLEADVKDNKDSKLKIKKGNITFKNVYFSYDNNLENAVIKDFSCEIKSAEEIGILGQTGSSKSTLLMLLLRFYDVTQGEILIDDINIKEYSLEEIRKNININFQVPFLFKGTILDNIAFGVIHFSMNEVIKATKIAECYDFIMNDLKDGFLSYVSEGGTNLSGGQRQRIALARLILLNPKIILLDDSFSALDHLTEIKVKDNLNKYLKDTTKIIVSQKISSIKDAKRIIVLNNGMINHIGNNEYLKENDDIYKDIYLMQNEGIE